MQDDDSEIEYHSDSSAGPAIMDDPRVPTKSESEKSSNSPCPEKNEVKFNPKNKGAYFEFIKNGCLEFEDFTCALCKNLLRNPKRTACCLENVCLDCWDYNL